MGNFTRLKLVRTVALAMILTALLFCTGCGSQTNKQVDLNLPTSEELEDVSSLLSSSEVQGLNTEVAAEVIAGVMNISDENAYEVAVRFFSIGISNLETIEKVKSDDGMAAVITTTDGMEYYINLTNDGVLKSIQMGGEEGSYIFTTETAEEAQADDATDGEN